MHENNNGIRIFAADTNIPNNSSIFNLPSTTMDKEEDWESIFGPGVTKTQEIIYVVVIIAAVLCMVAAVAIATVRRCTRRNREKARRKGSSISHKQESQAFVNRKQSGNGHTRSHIRGQSESVVNYVDERPGNHDINHIQMPLTSYNNNDSALKANNNAQVDEGMDDNYDVGMPQAVPQIERDGNSVIMNNGAGGNDSAHLSPNMNVGNGNAGNREESISAMSI